MYINTSNADPREKGFTMNAKTQTWYVGIKCGHTIINKKAFDSYDECHKYYTEVLCAYEWRGFDSAPVMWCEFK